LEMAGRRPRPPGTIALLVLTTCSDDCCQRGVDRGDRAYLRREIRSAESSRGVSSCLVTSAA
jgi:hypothetical protein